MTIKANLKIILAIILILAATTILSISLTMQKLQIEIEKSEIASNVLIDVFNLNTIVSDYVLYHEDRALEQWYITYDEIEGHLASERFATSEEKQYISSLSENHEKLSPIFEDLILIYTGDDDQQTRDELEVFLISRVLFASQEMVTDASSLDDHIRNKVSKSLKKLGIAAAAIIVLFVLLVIAVMLLIMHYVVRPIIKLRQSVKLIGKGDLSQQIKVTSKDEIGQLAEEFNQMAIRLSEFYALVEDKTKELQKRVSEIEHLNEVMVGRELNSADLKEELNKAKKKIKQLEGGNH